MKSYSHSILRWIRRVGNDLKREEVSVGKYLLATTQQVPETKAFI